MASGGARGLPESSRETIMALMPFIALALFFTSGFQWMWFLMVTVLGILLHGSAARCRECATHGYK